MKNIIFMKYGFHASEKGYAIIERKLAEEKACGMTMWGYGGTICHPLNQVQPFLTENYNAGEKTYLVLSRIETTWRGATSKAQFFSEDRNDWIPIPDEINVLGSKYALICRRFERVEIELNLFDYKVPLGKSAGSYLADYIVGHVTKGCGRLSQENSLTIPKLVTISACAEVEGAVFVA